MSRQAWAGNKQALARTAAIARVCISHTRACTSVPDLLSSTRCGPVVPGLSLQLLLPSELIPLPRLFIQSSLELVIRLRHFVSQTLVLLQYILVVTVSL
jgi:hypothetical protein